VVLGHREKYCLCLHAADAAFVYLGAVGPTDGRQQHTSSICPQDSTCRCQEGDPNAYSRQYPITPVIAGNSTHGTKNKPQFILNSVFRPKVIQVT